MSTTINGVTVRFGHLETDYRKMSVIVQVASGVRPGLKAQREIDPGAAADARQLAQGVGAAAALSAEYLCGKYGDRIDPAAAARDGIRALGEEARLIGELKRTLDEKLKRLSEHRALFSGPELALIDRVEFRCRQGGSPTPDELRVLNELVGRIHGAQLE